MTQRWWHAVVAASALLVIQIWPLTAALDAGDASRARLYSSVLTVVVCAVIAMAHRSGGNAWNFVTLAAAAGATVLLVLHVNATASCVADYDGRPVIIGRTLLPHTQDYIVKNPGASPADLLFDAGGVPARVWTTGSIAGCQFWLGWGGLASVPLLAAAVCAAIARRRYRTAAPPPLVRASHASRETPTYDAFISYRHTEPDRSHAMALVDELESCGYRVAIDFRDFRPNEHFLSEMERCVRESRFTVCVITGSYLGSDHTSEEAIISKTVDLAERRRRLVPILFERVELPAWLHGLSGIDATPAAEIDPVERLKALLATAA